MAELNLSLTGIPEEMFAEMQDCVIKTRVQNDIVLSRRKVPIVTKTPSKVVPGKFITSVKYEWADFFTPKTTSNTVTVYMTTMLLNYILEGGYVVKGRDEDGGWLMEREERHWERDGQQYMMPFASLIVKKEGNRCVFDDIEAMENYAFEVVMNGVKSQSVYSLTEMAAKLGKTEAQVIALQNDYYVGGVIDLNKAIGSMLLAAEVNGEDINFDLFVNLKRWTEIENVRQLLNSVAQPLGAWSMKYALLNGCVNNDVKDADSYGNFGECAESGYLNSTDPNSFNIKCVGVPGVTPSFDEETRTFTYDSDKPAVLVASTHEEPFNGKEPSTELYIDLKTGQQYYSASQASQASKAS